LHLLARGALVEGGIHPGSEGSAGTAIGGTDAPEYAVTHDLLRHVRPLLATVAGELPERVC
jgi:hypothetical protein